MLFQISVEKAAPTIDASRQTALGSMMDSMVTVALLTEAIDDCLTQQSS